MDKKIVGLGVVFVVLLIVLLIILANRNSGSGTSVTVTPTQSSGQVTLIWWNLFEPEENVKPLIAAFESEYPNIKIQYTQVGLDGIENYKTELQNSLTDQDVVTSPDIFPIHNTWMGKFQNLLVPAPSTVISSTDMQDFYAIVSKDFLRSQKVYALPMSLDAIALIYNKTKLREKGYQAPALTWNDLKTQAVDLTVRDQINNITYAGFSAYDPETSEFYFEVMNQLFLQNDVLMVDSTTDLSKIGDNDNASSAVSYYRNFLEGFDSTWDPKFKKDIAAFLENNLAMYPAPSWRLINVLEYNDYYKLNIDVGVATMPQLTGGGDFYWPTYWGQTVAKDSQYSKEAWQFIEFITQQEQLQLYNDTVKANGRPIGIIFPRISQAEINQSDPYLAPYAASLAKAQNWDMKDGWELKKMFDSLFSSNNAGIDAIQGAINKVRQEATITPTP